jgi:small-conductance mechanosensitive channel
MILPDIPKWRLGLAIAFVMVSLIGSSFGRYFDTKRISTNASFLRKWLKQIGSDIYWYSWSIGICAVAFAISGYWFNPIAFVTPTIGLLTVIFACLLAIAGITIGGEVLEEKIVHNEKLDAIDKRNYLTSLPILASICKLAIYVFTAILLLSCLRINIGPVLGASAIVVVPIAAATVSAISNLLATLTIFLDRVLYHGDRVRIGDFEGVVIKITAFRTFLMADNGDILCLLNQKLEYVTKLNKSDTVSVSSVDKNSNS